RSPGGRDHRHHRGALRAHVAALAAAGTGAVDPRTGGTQVGLHLWHDVRRAHRRAAPGAERRRRGVPPAGRRAGLTRRARSGYREVLLALPTRSRCPTIGTSWRRTIRRRAVNRGRKDQTRLTPRTTGWP